MGKEKEMLKAILLNTQLIIKHLKIDAEPAGSKEPGKLTIAKGKKSPKKAAPVKKAGQKK